MSLENSHSVDWLRKQRNGWRHHHWDPSWSSSPTEQWVLGKSYKLKRVYMDCIDHDRTRFSIYIVICTHTALMTTSTSHFIYLFLPSPGWCHDSSACPTYSILIHDELLCRHAWYYRVNREEPTSITELCQQGKGRCGLCENKWCLMKYHGER